VRARRRGRADDTLFVRLHHRRGAPERLAIACEHPCRGESQVPATLSAGDRRDCLGQREAKRRDCVGGSGQDADFLGAGLVDEQLEKAAGVRRPLVSSRLGPPR